MALSWSVVLFDQQGESQGANPCKDYTSGGIAHKECCFYLQLQCLISLGFTPICLMSDTYTIKQPPCPLLEPYRTTTGGPHATTWQKDWWLHCQVSKAETTDSSFLNELHLSQHQNTGVCLVCYQDQNPEETQRNITGRHSHRAVYNWSKNQTGNYNWQGPQRYEIDGKDHESIQGDWWGEPQQETTQRKSNQVGWGKGVSLCEQVKWAFHIQQMDQIQKYQTKSA